MHEGKDKKKKKKDGIRISAYGPGSLTLSNLTNAEKEDIEAMVHNHFFVSVTKGRLDVVRRRKQLPDPIEDKDMFPFWRTATPGPKQLQLFELEIPEYSSPSIIIQYLCGYGYSVKKYKEEARRLESYGFECMRSQRGKDAQFWELWYLPALWAAKGALKEALACADTNSSQAAEIAVKFLCRNAEFGSLNVSFQRAAMVLD